MARGADAVTKGGRQHRRPRYREWPVGPRAVVRTWACAESPCARTGRSDGRPSASMMPRPTGSRGGRSAGAGREGNAKSGARDERPWEVRRLRSTCEAAEQVRRPAAEAVEGRRPAEGNAASKTRPGRRAGSGASSALDRVRAGRTKDRDARFTALLHHVDVDRLRAAYRAMSPRAAAGVDEVTWQAYGQELEANLQDLHRPCPPRAATGRSRRGGCTSRRRTGG